ncbi:MAG: DUF2281 domain-containing protein [Candidatus Zixiibacteriota bacterium]
MKVSENHEEKILEDLKALPKDKIIEVEDFVRFLKEKHQSSEKKAPRKKIVSLEGLWEGLDVSEDEIKEARQKAWDKLSAEEII